MKAGDMQASSYSRFLKLYRIFELLFDWKKINFEMRKNERDNRERRENKERQAEIKWEMTYLKSVTVFLRLQRFSILFLTMTSDGRLPLAMLLLARVESEPRNPNVGQSHVATTLDHLKIKLKQTGKFTLHLLCYFFLHLYDNKFRFGYQILFLCHTLYSLS